MMDKKSIIIKKQKIVYYESILDSQKAFVVYLHGWGQSKKSFLPVINKVNKNFVSLDLPGFGESFEPTQVFSIYDYADCVYEFLKVKKIKNIILVGHSFGARISLILSQKDLNIKKIILTGAAGIKPKRSFFYYLKIGGYKFQKFLIKTPFYSQYKEDLLNNSGSLDYKNSSPMMKKILISVVNEDLKYLLPKIEQKVILFWGKFDEATPLEDGLLMDKEIKNSKLLIVEGTHYAFLEYVDEFSNLI